VTAVAVDVSARMSWDTERPESPGPDGPSSQHAATLPAHAATAAVRVSVKTRAMRASSSKAVL
jgi:hypothetical protein